MKRMRLLIVLSLVGCGGPNLRQVYDQHCLEDASSCAVAARSYLDAERGPRDPKRAADIIVNNCSRNQSVCMAAGVVVEDALQIDPRTGIAVGTRFCEAGFAQVCLRLSHLYDRSGPSTETQISGFPENHAQSLALLERGCAGDTKAYSDTYAAMQCCEELATIYREGKGVPADAARADQLVGQAAALRGKFNGQADAFGAEQEAAAARAQRESERLTRQAAEDEANRKAIAQGVSQALNQTAQDLERMQKQGPSAATASPESRAASRSTPAPAPARGAAGAQTQPGRASGNVPDACANPGEACGTKSCCHVGAAERLNLQCRANRCCGGYGGHCSSDADCCDAPTVTCNVGRGQGQTVCCRRSGVGATAADQCCSLSLSPPNYNTCL